MLTSIQQTPVIHGACQRLVAAGKHRKAALTAGMRKMGTILDAMPRNRTPWRVEHA